MNMSNNTQPSAMNMSNNTQANSAPENDERVLNLIDRVGKNVPDVMSMSNNTQANAAAENDERVLNLIDRVGKNVSDVVENSGIPKSVNSPDTQLKLGSTWTEKGKDPVREPNLTETFAVKPSGISRSVLELAERPEAELKLGPSRTEKGKDPVREPNLTQAVEVAATTEAGDGAIPIPRKQRKIPADATENGGLRRSKRPRKPNLRLKGYELYDPQRGYYIN